MGLGSQDDRRRKDFQVAAGYSDWKAKIRTWQEADDMITKIESSVGKYPDGQLILDTYATKKLRDLRAYIAHCKALGPFAERPDFKTFLKQNP